MAFDRKKRVNRHFYYLDQDLLSLHSLKIFARKKIHKINKIKLLKHEGREEVAALKHQVQCMSNHFEMHRYEGLNGQLYHEIQMQKCKLISVNVYIFCICKSTLFNTYKYFQLSCNTAIHFSLQPHRASIMLLSMICSKEKEE